MSTYPFLLLIASAALCLSSCDRSKKSAPPSAPAAPESATRGDSPLLPVKKGDTWTYAVHLTIPEGVTSPGAAEVDSTYERVRTYLGKIVVTADQPEVDCFEVVHSGAPAEREFVEIQDDKILMRGSMIMRPESQHPMWLPQPVPFVFSGMKPGTESAEIRAPGGSISRKTQVVAREDVVVPAGTYPSIRLLMTGMDGEIELRRTIWFSPGTGIVKEEKVRYRKGQVIFREAQELSKTSVVASR